MPAEPINGLGPDGPAPGTPGDLPPALCSRYFHERGRGSVRLYLDPIIRRPVLEDRGRLLVARRADSNLVRDMVEIARHRGWSAVIVRGDAAFRREAWLTGTAAGLEVQGYRPTERDRQQLERQLARDAERDQTRTDPLAQPRAAARLAVVEEVVRARLSEPAAQARVVARARERLAAWLERGGRTDAWASRPRSRQADERQR